MFHSIINEYDILYNNANYQSRQYSVTNSSNPYDFINKGYYIENAELFGGQNNVLYNINISGNISGNH